MEDISFDASDLDNSQVNIDRAYVLNKIAGIVKDADLSKYIL